jgi:GTP-binding protein HflX
LVPYDRGDLVARVHRDGDVLRREDVVEGTRLVARVSPELAALLAP